MAAEKVEIECMFCRKLIPERTFYEHLNQCAYDEDQWDRKGANKEISEDVKFKVGDRCQVYSKSNKKWFPAEIIEEVTTKRGREFTVRYRIGNQFQQKRITPNSKHLKPIDASNNEGIIVKCICEAEMVWMLAGDCYKADKDEKEDNDDDECKDDKKMDGTEPSKHIDIEAKINALISEGKTKKEAAKLVLSMMDPNKSNVSCDGCGYSFSNDEKLFHCPQKKTAVHNYGSDYCYKCAVYDETDAHVQNIEQKDDSVNADILARQLGDEPFAQGTSRYAYLGLWETGKKKGMRCVIKRHKNKHLLFADGYDGDIKCCNLAAELVNKWNENNLTNKKYEIVVPIIARKSGLKWEILLLMAALFGDLKDEDMSKILDPKDNKSNKHISSGEVVMVEDFLKGEFIKWNSNSGWMGDEKTTVQAFCHWTYDYGDEQYLFCDAQGVKKPEKYILTDPAILSNTEEGGIYGVTDMGRKYLLNWFRQHKCNKFCNSKWKKPSQIDLDSVPQNIRKCTQKSTSYNKSKLIESKQLDGSGSVIPSKTLDSIEEKDENIENMDKSRNSVNKYDDQHWGEYDKYLSWQNGERIMMCTKVKETNKSSNRRESILLLSSWEKLYIINPKKDVNDSAQKEYSKKQVKKIELQTSNKFILHLFDGKWHFKVIDDKYDAKTWQKLIDNNLGCEAMVTVTLESGSVSKSSARSIATQNNGYNRIASVSVVESAVISMNKESDEKHEENEWQQYNKYLSQRKGETVVMCTKVFRQKAFGLSTQNRVLLLSSFEKLYIINPNNNKKEVYQNVEKVEIKAKDKFIVYLSGNKITFTVNDNKYDANTWKEAIDDNIVNNQ